MNYFLHIAKVLTVTALGLAIASPVRADQSRELIEPEVIEPEVIELEVIEPEVIEPEAIEPAVIEPIIPNRIRDRIRDRSPTRTRRLFPALTLQFAESQLQLHREVSPEEKASFLRVMEDAIAGQWHDRPFGEIVQLVAEQFIGTPYAGGLLDKSMTEKLTITLDAFDCVLFVETVLAIARGVAIQDHSYPAFADRLREQRYRNGQLDDYCSRLHYFSDWIDDNQRRGIVRNITRDLGGATLPKKLDFMTRNWRSYPQLASDANYECMVERENFLNDEVALFYIPQHQIHQVYDRLQPGDIIATATDIKGLDVTHTGLVYRHSDGGIGFIHASPIGEVVIARDLQSYVEAVDGQIGIILARPSRKSYLRRFRQG